MTNLDTHLFAPLSRQERLEERAEQLTKETIENLWLELTDELEVEKFIRNYVADPHKMLRDIIQKVALTKSKISSIHCVSRDLDKIGAYTRIQDDISEYIERAADHIVEEKMYA